MAVFIDVHFVSRQYFFVSAVENVWYVCCCCHCY